MKPDAIPKCTSFANSQCTSWHIPPLMQYHVIAYAIADSVLPLLPICVHTSLIQMSGNSTSSADVCASSHPVGDWWQTLGFKIVFASVKDIIPSHFPTKSGSNQSFLNKKTRHNSSTAPPDWGFFNLVDVPLAEDKDDLSGQKKQHGNGVSKNRGKTPKMDGENNGKPY